MGEILLKFFSVQQFSDFNFDFNFDFNKIK